MTGRKPRISPGSAVLCSDYLMREAFHYLTTFIISETSCQRLRGSENCYTCCRTGVTQDAQRVQECYNVCPVADSDQPGINVQAIFSGWRRPLYPFWFRDCTWTLTDPGNKSQYPLLCFIMVTQGTLKQKYHFCIWKCHSLWYFFAFFTYYKKLYFSTTIGLTHWHLKSLYKIIAM